MAITLEDLRAYVGASASNDAELERARLTGVALVDAWVGRVTTVQVDVLDHAYLIAASEVFQRRQAPMGIAQFATPDGAPVRVNKDPMTAVYPLLAPFLGWGFA